MRRTKARRDIAPAFTWSKRPRKPRSSMDASHPGVEAVPVPDAPAILQDACKRDGNRPARRRQRLGALSSSPVIRGRVGRGQATRAIAEVSDLKLWDVPTVAF